jgi:glycosyltransferase involved in cell wall biosynthesis
MDVDSLVGSLEEFCLDYEKRLKFGAESYKLLSLNYSLEIFRKRYLKLFSNM